MDKGGGRYQRTLDEVWRAAVHYLRPPAKDHAAYRQNIMRGRHRVDPSFYGISLFRILLPGDFNPCLQLTQRNCREEQLLVKSSK